VYDIPTLQSNPLLVGIVDSRGLLINPDIEIGKFFLLTKSVAFKYSRIFDKSKSMSEIAYELGFKYPQHFTRMFKNSVGVSPGEYRSSN